MASLLRKAFDRPSSSTLRGEQPSILKPLAYLTKIINHRVLGCQGDTWIFNEYSKRWEGNPVFDPDFKTYFESLKNRSNRTAETTQALPMLPKDLKMIMRYLDGEEAKQELSETKRLYFKAFATTSFCLWTRCVSNCLCRLRVAYSATLISLLRNDELINLQFKDVKQDQVSRTGIRYIEFTLIFRKTNKDPDKRRCQFNSKLRPRH